jgi:hypothetical protein
VTQKGERNCLVSNFVICAAVQLQRTAIKSIANLNIPAILFRLVNSCTSVSDDLSLGNFWVKTSEKS